MALQSQQLVSLACNTAKAPGYLSLAGQHLNMILQELAQLNDFELSRALLVINAGAPAGYTTTSNLPYYNLAPDHLHILKDGVFYEVNGVPYLMIQKTLSQMDQMISTPGFTAQLLYYAVDDSTTPSQIMFWPPANAPYAVNVRYARQIPDITTPESSATIPWFPLQSYLLMELTARMMELANDDRADGFHAKADRKLSKWLAMQRDIESSTYRVELDKNRFSTGYNLLPNTKTVGW